MQNADQNDLFHKHLINTQLIMFTLRKQTDCEGVHILTGLSDILLSNLEWLWLGNG